jgi:hypothetical protein
MAACPLASLDPSSGAVKEPGLQRIVADSFGLSPSPWPGRAHARDARHGDVASPATGGRSGASRVLLRTSGGLRDLGQRIMKSTKLAPDPCQTTEENFMNKHIARAASAATLAVLVLAGSPAMAKGGGSSGTWPTDLPLPTDPGTVMAQSSTTAVVRSTDTVGVVKSKLDQLYVVEKGCTRQLGVNKPRDFLCYNPETDRTDEVLFTFAALDPTATDSALSQTNAFYLEG